uniref:Sulfotransfer_1 domain-containing protein n=1 Tax=Rhabditophanes sp. KR3021 TaxID=114890 RepID=A0AC35TP11_9BILA
MKLYPCMESRNDNKCIPLFPISVPDQNILSKKYKINFCLISKNFSTKMRQIYCYLERPILFARNKNNNKRLHKLCDPLKKSNKVSLNKASRMNKTNTTTFLNTYQHVVVVRDPIERFVSGWSYVCAITKFWKQDKRNCLGCKNNLVCFINALYNKVFKSAKYSFILKEPKFMEDHFYPQSWRCGVNKYKNRTKLLLYGSSKETQVKFFKELTTLLQQRHVPKKQLTFITKNILGQRSGHTTIGKKERLMVEKKIYSNKTLVNILVKIFYNDYIAFDLKFPKQNIDLESVKIITA